MDNGLCRDCFIRRVTLDFLQEIKAYRAGDKQILGKHKWLMYLALTQEKHINLERVTAKKDVSSNYVLEYVEKTLNLLQSSEYPLETKKIVATVLQWSEVAKTGLMHQRRLWMENQVNLFVHNEGSADIFHQWVTDGKIALSQINNEKKNDTTRIIEVLIRTHGLIGQYLRGEVPLKVNVPLYELIEQELISGVALKEILLCLNYCIIGAVDLNLWNRLSKDVERVIDFILTNEWDKEFTHLEKIRKLRYQSILKGDNGDNYNILEVEEHLDNVFLDCTLWYVESALGEFSFEEFIKILLLCSMEVQHQRSIGKVIRHVYFENMMHAIYYDYHDKKRVNVYKKRIIEHFLKSLSIEAILNGEKSTSPHIIGLFNEDEAIEDTLFFDIQFSKAALKLIDFCVEAEQSEVLYEKAIILLYDLFELRHDRYDRFNEEERYLATMNQSIDYKRILLDHITGDCVLDIGPGGGALMDLIEATFPQKKVSGIDISTNVIDALTKKKQLEGKAWNIVQGNALDLKETFQVGEVDTIIFCSIMHELFSYIELEGKKFNHETLKVALKSAFDILPVGGRIIIRDGIMTAPVDTMRRIRFLSEEGLEFLQRYSEDFQGRQVTYELVGQNEVIMKINDAMEFLYTYTWGEKSYIHEIQEQFGYFTPEDFRRFIMDSLGERGEIITLEHFLQEGYSIALSPKIEFFDLEHNEVALPDSTCIIVIEKK